MFVTLTQLQNGEASLLQTVIDNTCCKLHVALRGFHYEVGYRNVGSSSRILWRSITGDKPRNILVPAGLYNFEQLAQVFMEEIPGVTVKITKATGTIKLNIQGGIIKLSNDLRRILGIDEKDWMDGW